MASAFLSFLGFGKKSKKFARYLDDDSKEKSYPRAMKPTRKATKKLLEENPFAGATPATTGSWIACQDPDGNPYWWNDVTGQWTYQLYSTSSFAPPMYSYHQYPPQYVMGHQQQQQQTQPYLGSPSGAHQQSPWGPMVLNGPSGSMLGGLEQQGDGFTNFNFNYDPVGREVWVHPTTGQPYPMNS